MAKTDPGITRRGRIAALVIAAAGLSAILAPVLTVGLGLSPRWEILVYLAALAAFFWSLVETWSIWQIRRKQESGADPSGRRPDR